MSKYWNSTVKQLQPYVPGEQPKDMKYIKLNTNESPYPPSPRVLEAISEGNNGTLRLYPDPNTDNLRNVVAEYYDIDKDEVFVGNGSDEVLAFSFMTFFSPEKKVLFPDITYSFYKVYAKLLNLDTEIIPLDEEFNIPIEKLCKNSGGVVLANPNAPTSKEVSIDDIKRILESNRDNVVIVDEAYIDFGGASVVNLIKDYDNLLVVQTLSKSRALAGLRVGFALGSKELIEGLNRLKNSINSYTIDRIAIVGAIAAFEDEAYFKELTSKIINTREETIVKLRDIGFKVMDSKANFVFVSHKKMKAEEIFKELRKKGILVRYFNEPRINNFLRITIGTDEEMKTLIEELKNILN
ncbi:Histidinol-phosphate aminotransferase [Clostridium bornimense]|uniref:Histidinol-phosphate aminotransferase n=1 Tax=Clostridium bornimense TaxID=1216932 RepID=W6RVL5_9CLOT|nr:histidinol-phosphate transaminase [Clostridium bornimense]CDM67649.1 Histidinol-phosphate aminotransferase [Clostridium bornimense]